MNVLVACEFSGVVRDAFRTRGHNAWSCDLLPCEKGQNWHIQGDVLDVLTESAQWDLMIAHPPCTYLCNSGVRWLYKKQAITGKRVRSMERWRQMWGAAEFFKALLDAKVDKIAVENPVPHGHAQEWMGRKYDQTIQPWQFGHGETKRTCLWLKGLPALRSTEIVDGREARIHKMSPGPERGKLRSITYRGIADAMAEQWG